MCSTQFINNNKIYNILSYKFQIANGFSHNALFGFAKFAYP